MVFRGLPRACWEFFNRDKLELLNSKNTVSCPPGISTNFFEKKFQKKTEELRLPFPLVREHVRATC